MGEPPRPSPAQASSASASSPPSSVGSVGSGLWSASLGPGAPSDVEFLAARRAVELGLVPVAAVEEALAAEDDAAPAARRGLLARLPLGEAQRAAIAGRIDPPPEVLAALGDPARTIGRYALCGALGQGGMAEVFRAWDPRLGRFVALKVLRRFEDARARECFEREARLAAGLALPGVAAIHEIAVEGGRPYFAMQLVEGDTLAQVAARGIEASRAAALILTAARTVERAHARGVLHRDLKPGNLMLDRDGRLFVMDFGLARPLAEAEDGVGAPPRSSLTGAGLVGTPEYMPPEQARGGPRRADARSDVYGLGACLYELLARRPPFVTRDRADVIAEVLRDRPAPPSTFAPGIPAGLDALVLRCLDKDPDRRPPTAGALAAELERFAEPGGGGERGGGRGREGEGEGGRPAPAQAPRPSAPGPVRQRPRAAAALSLALGLAGALAAGAWVRAAGSRVASRPDLDAARPPADAPALPAAASSTGPWTGAPIAAGPPVPVIAGFDAKSWDVVAVDGAGERLFIAGSDAAGQRLIASAPTTPGGRLERRLDVPDHPMGLAVTTESLCWIDMNSAPPDHGSRLYRSPLPPPGAGSLLPPEVLYEGTPTVAPIEDGSGLATDGQALFAVDQVGGTVHRVERDGALRRLAGPRYPGGFRTEHLNSIAWADGQLFVADAGAHKVTPPEVLTLPDGGGSFTSLWRGAPLGAPTGIAAAGGWVFVADPAAGNAIFALPVGGGGPPRVVVSGPPFVAVRGIAAAGRTLYVTDTGNVRDSRGELIDGPGQVFRVDLSE